MIADPSPPADRVSPLDRPQARPGVAAVEIDGDVVLLDEEGQVHLLNPTAGLLWGCFDGEGSIAEIAADVADAFGIAVEQVETEVLTLAEGLVTLGVLLLDDARVAVDEASDPRDGGEDGDDEVVVQPGGY